MVEPDIDYYQDLGADAILEVIPNALTHSLTDPTEVYVLCWIACGYSRNTGIRSSVHDHFLTKSALCSEVLPMRPGLPSDMDKRSGFQALDHYARLQLGSRLW